MQDSIKHRKFMDEKRSRGSKQYANIKIKKNDPSYMFYNIMYPSNKIQCDICKRDITKFTKILANQSDFCVSCFSNLQSYPQSYNAINKLDYPVFEVDWSAEQQLLMFEGLQKHGFGNWSQIADFIGTNKSREDVQQHYTLIYLDPQINLNNREVLSRRENSGRLYKKSNPNPTKRTIKDSKKDPQENKQKSQRGSLTVSNLQNSTLKNSANAAQIVGYMPKRGDFEVEYDNDAELLLAQMEFNDDDTAEEKEMKFKMMEIYNQKLTERIRRKQFVTSRKLLDLKQQTRLDKGRSKQEKQIYNMMKVFARFNNPQEHEKLVQGIIRQKQIRQRIQQLKQFKKKGFRTLAQIEQQLQLKRRNQQNSKSKKLQQSNYFSHSEYPKNTRRFKKDTPIQVSQKRSICLTQDEEQICRKFNINSKQYIAIKETIIRQSVKQGILQKDELNKIFVADRTIVDGIFDFLVQREDIIER